MLNTTDLLADLRAACERLSASDLPATAGYREDAAEIVDAIITLQHRVASALRREATTMPARSLHDLRSPLNVVIGYAQILADDVDLPGEITALADSIYKDGVRLNNALTEVFSPVLEGDDVIR